MLTPDTSKGAAGDRPHASKRSALNAAGMEVGIDSDGDEGLNSVRILREVLGISEEPAERTRSELASFRDNATARMPPVKIRNVTCGFAMSLKKELSEFARQ